MPARRGARHGRVSRGGGARRPAPRERAGVGRDVGIAAASGAREVRAVREGARGALRGAAGAARARGRWTVSAARALRAAVLVALAAFFATPSSLVAQEKDPPPPTVEKQADDTLAAF